MTILTVGTGEQYTTIAAAVAATRDGDVVAVDAGTYTNNFFETHSKITIEAVGGLVKLVATAQPPNGKAIITSDTDLTVIGLDISGASVPDNNGAAIRYQGGNLTVIDSSIHNNQDGILGSPGTAGTGSVTIVGSDFGFNGANDGYTHDIYVGNVGTLTVERSYIHDAIGGHEIKSRALVTLVDSNRIEDNASPGNYQVDAPNGGVVAITNNVIEKGPNDGNSNTISFGEEGGLPANNSLVVSGNVISDDLAGHPGVGVNNTTGTAATVTGNSFYNIGSGNILHGAGTASGNVLLSSRPALDASAQPSAPTAQSGTAALSVVLSEDAWMGDAQAVVSVDGTQVFAGAVTALHGGPGQQIALGSYNAATSHQVSVSFTNDAAGAAEPDDRNLYVDSIWSNGVVRSGSAALFSNGTSTATIAASTPASPYAVTDGSGTQVLHINASEDRWLGDAQFIVSVDGAQVGGVQTATALRNGGQGQDFYLYGNFGAGQHDVAVSFVNDAWGGTSDTDRNLYVNTIDLGGQALLPAPLTFLGATTSHVTAPAAVVSGIATAQTASLPVVAGPI